MVYNQQMENLDTGSPIRSDEMAPGRTSESSRLISQNTSRPNYLNVPSYLCALAFLLIIIYCCIVNGAVLFAFHPILMTLGWLGLMTIAVNAITPGDLASEWMPIRLRSARHWVLQVLTAIIVITGFIVIVSNKIINDKPHFQSLHSKFGLASFVLMFATMLGGLCALYSLKLKNYIPPLFTKIIHSSAGIITYSLGIVTVSLALFSTWWTYGETLRYLSLMLVLIIAVITILRPSLKVYFRISERIDNTK